MTYAIWDPQWSVGVRSIDGQHQHLFDLLNRLYEAMQDGRGYIVINGTLEELLEYAHSHFAIEEAYFDRFHYPGSEEHKRAHRAFLMRIMRFRAECSVNPAVSLETLIFLIDWLRVHVRTADRKYAEYIRQVHSEHIVPV